MLTYSLADTGTDSLYLYLYKCIKNDILNGTLASGTKLPSKRSFAKNLGVSNITVENSYGLLQAEGYIFSLPKRGFFVSDLRLPAAPQTGNARMGSDAEKTLAAGKRRADTNTQAASFAAVFGTDGNMPMQPPVFSSAAASGVDGNMPAQPPVFSSAAASGADGNIPAQPPVFADFVGNHTTPESFPFSIWAKLLRETISQKSDELMASPPCGGIFELRSAICAHLRQFRGMETAPEQIIIGAGTDYLYSLLILLLGRDKIYAIENPGYQKIEKVYKSHGVDYRFVGMDSSGIKIDDLNQENADIAHISPSHHYPTGIVTPISRRYELLAWASARPGRYIIEDDYDSEFRFAARPMPTLQGIDAMETVIYMNTFTKSLAPTIRISYMVLPPHLLERFYKELSFYSGTVSNFEQYTLAKFIREGYFEKHINRMRNYYRSIRDALLAAIGESPLAGCSRVAEESAGLHFILWVRTPLATQELLARARERGVRISCLSEYYCQGKETAGEGRDFAGATAFPTGQESLAGAAATPPATGQTGLVGAATTPSDIEPTGFIHALVMNYSGIRRETIKSAVCCLAESVLPG